MESPAMVPRGKKMRKSFIMSLYRYAAGANKVSQKPEPEVSPISPKKVNIMTRQLSCRETTANRSGSVANQQTRLVSYSNEEEIGKQQRAILMPVQGGRRSVSQVETNLKNVISFLQVKVMVTDMPGFMLSGLPEPPMIAWTSLAPSTLLLTSRRNLTGHMVRLGIALWDLVSDLLSLIPLVASSTSLWTSFAFYSSKPKFSKHHLIELV